MIEMKGVSFRYDGAERNVLTNINLTIQDGECVVLTGASGCGKTTITRFINGLIPHFYDGEVHGTVTINGENCFDLQPHELAEKVGSVFQNPRTQFFNTDTDSEIVFGMENCAVPYEEMHRRYESTVKNLDLKSLCGKDVFTLSGGQKQSIAFGSVYALAPDVYILDEPSANLDRESIQRLHKVLLTLKQMGKTILVSEHRLYYLRDIADRFILVEDGQITGTYAASTLCAMTLTQLHELGLRSLQDTNIQTDTSVHTDKAPALEVRNICVSRGKTEIIRDANLSVSQGEIVGIVGQNGIGKTTLARTICGLIHEKEGGVYFNGVAIKPKKRKQHVFLVMQDPNFQLFCDSVEAELELTVTGEKPDETYSQQLLQELNLDVVRKKHPLALSGGQKQRVCIALAALSGAEVLLFDEPTSGLDYKNMERVADMLRMLAAQGKAVAVISHDYEFLSETCTRIVTLS